MTIAQYQSIGIGLLQSIEKHKFFAISNSIEGVANLILSLLLVRRYGIVGVALGTAIPMILIKVFVQPMITCRALGLKLSRFLSGVSLPLLGGIAFFAAAYYVMGSSALGSWLDLGLGVAAFSVVYFSYAILLIGSEDRVKLRRSFYG